MLGLRLCVLDKVEAQTPERMYAAAAARAAAQQPLGWTRPPPRHIKPWHIVRGVLHCSQDACRARSLRYRDVNVCRLILKNALSVDAGHGTLPCIRHGRHGEDPPGRFFFWPGN